MVVRSVNLSRIEKTRGTVLFHLGRNRVISAGNWKLIEPSSDEKCLMSNVQWHGKKDGNVESIMFHRPPFIFLPLSTKISAGELPMPMPVKKRMSFSRFRFTVS